MSVLGAIGNFFSSVPIVGDVIDAASDWFSTKSAETHQYNMFKEQLGFQKDLYDDAKAYNAMGAQRERLEQAGLNPYLMLNGGSSVAADPMSAPSAPTGPKANLSGLGNALRNLPQYQFMQEQINAQKELVQKERTENLWRNAQQYADLQEKLSNVNKNTQEYHNLKTTLDLLKVDLDYNQRTLNARTRQQETLADMLYEQELGQSLQNIYTRQTIEAFPSITQAQINSLNAATSAAYADVRLKHSMSNTEVEKAANLVTERTIMKLQRENIPVSQEQENALRRANKAYIEAVTNKVENTDNFIQNYAPLLNGAAAAGAGALLKGAAVGAAAPAASGYPMNGYE